MTRNTTLPEILKELKRYNILYDALRIIDPATKTVIERSENLNHDPEYNYLDFWGEKSINDDSIEIRAFQRDECFIKLEHRVDSTFLVTAFPIEISNEKLVLELLKNVTNSLPIGSKNYSDPTNNLALKDELTNLFNRRYVDDRLLDDIMKAFTEQLPISLVFLDVDNLKEINDRLGHAFGDKVLIEIADIIMRSIRSNTDWVARYGGDEFLICLNNTEAREAFYIAERIRNNIAELVVIQNKNIKTTASLGISCTEKYETTATELISLADKKMYMAKRNGKNCTIL